MPKRFCLHPGCHDYATTRSRCHLHHKEHDRSIDRKGRTTYGTKRWQILRRKVLSEEPFCRHCQAEGLETLATEVDHIVAIQDGGDEWARANLQSLCQSHHSQKTRREQIARGGEGRPAPATRL